MFPIFCSTMNESVAGTTVETSIIIMAMYTNILLPLSAPSFTIIVAKKSGFFLKKILANPGKKTA